MALEDILKRVDADAQAAVAALVQQAAEAVREMEEAVIAQTREAVQHREKKTAEAIVKNKRRIIQQAELAGRKRLLAARQQLVQQVMGRVAEQLDQLGDQEYGTFLQQLLGAFSGEGEYTFSCSAASAPLLNQGFLDQVNKQLATNKKPFSLTLARETEEMGRGFMLRQNRLTLNFSFTALLAEAWQEHYPAIVKLVFPDKDQV